MAKPGWTITSCRAMPRRRLDAGRVAAAWFSARHSLRDQPAGLAILALIGAACGYLYGRGLVGIPVGAVIAPVAVLVLVLVANLLMSGDVYVLRATDGRRGGMAVAYVSATNRHQRRLVTNVRAAPQGAGLGGDLMAELGRDATGSNETLELDCRTELISFYGSAGFTVASRKPGFNTWFYGFLNTWASLEWLPRWMRPAKNVHMVR